MDTIIDKFYDKYSEEFIRYTLFNAALGIKAMHDKFVLHRDIKSGNILCNPQGDIKVADLGLSVLLSEGESWRRTRTGTKNWFSPEIVKGEMYSKEVDVWAFGSFAHELGCGRPPFFYTHKRD